MLIGQCIDCSVNDVLISSFISWFIVLIVLIGELMCRLLNCCANWRADWLIGSWNSWATAWTRWSSSWWAGPSWRWGRSTETTSSGTSTTPSQDTPPTAWLRPSGDLLDALVINNMMDWLSITWCTGYQWHDLLVINHMMYWLITWGTGE